MKRRDFITLVGAAAAWPLMTRAQQPAMPVIGFLGSASSEEYALRLRAFRQGLKEFGYIEGQNVIIEYRWAGDDYGRLPALAKELVDRRVAVIVAGGGTPAAMVVKAVVTTIPVIFAVGVNPVDVGLVASLNHPGGNLTGVSNLNVELAQKKVQVLRELLPTATQLAVLINPTSPVTAPFLRELQPAAKALGFQLHVVEASSDSDLETVFSRLSVLKAEALVITPDNFFNTRTESLAKLSFRHAVPTIQNYRPFVAAGGLVSYSSDENEYYRLIGTQAGRILKGDKPGDLPVQQSTKAELIINLKTAKALGVTVPLSLLARADEVIE
jgi:putative ABC transport system substrate-binding protein